MIGAAKKLDFNYNHVSWSSLLMYTAFSPSSFSVILQNSSQALHCIGDGSEDSIHHKVTFSTSFDWITSWSLLKDLWHIIQILFNDLHLKQLLLCQSKSSELLKKYEKLHKLGIRNFSLAVKCRYQLQHYWQPLELIFRSSSKQMLILI